MRQITKWRAFDNEEFEDEAACRAHETRWGRSVNLNDYQNKAIATAIYPGMGGFLGLVYTSLKLNGEAGEVAEKVGKIMRDKASIVSAEDADKLMFELGDVLWYVAAAANELGWSLEFVANANLKKLRNRAARGVLAGSGDSR